MKITKITLDAFRGFDSTFEIDLEGGKNLLVHGENGSGKSSIYYAIRRFFEERGGDVNDHRNQFSATGRLPCVTVHVSGIDASGAQFDMDVPGVQRTRIRFKSLTRRLCHRLILINVQHLSMLRTAAAF